MLFLADKDRRAPEVSSPEEVTFPTVTKRAAERGDGFSRSEMLEHMRLIFFQIKASVVYDFPGSCS